MIQRHVCIWLSQWPQLCGTADAKDDLKSCSAFNPLFWPFGSYMLAYQNQLKLEYSGQQFLNKYDFLITYNRYVWKVQCSQIFLRFYFAMAVFFFFFLSFSSFEYFTFNFSSQFKIEKKKDLREGIVKD